MNPASWIILGIVVVLFIAVILILTLSKDKGCCGCNNTDCPHHKKKK